MMAEPIDLARSVLQSLAQRYRDEGFEVVTEPQPADLPRSLRRFQPDLIARRGSEGLVVEVERRRSAMAGAGAQIERLAEAVRGLPGWRFELVLIDDVVEGPNRAGRGWSNEDVQRALDEAEELVKAERLESALLLLFAAAEAQLRSVAAAEGVTVLSQGVSPLASALTSAGVLSRKEYAMLIDELAARNAVAHGRRPEPMPDQEALLRLVDVVRQLGQEPASAAGHPASP